MMPLTLFWKQFRKFFIAALEECSNDEFQTAWNSVANRTDFYKSRLIPSVARNLELVQRHELFKVDIALCKKSTQGHDVPMAFIESENFADSAHHEMWKLCSLASPLKVLITCAEWGEHWKNSKKTDLLARWQPIIKSHNEVWPHPSVYGIVVGELHENSIRFYSCVYGQDGSEIEAHEQIFVRKIR